MLSRKAYQKLIGWKQNCDDKVLLVEVYTRTSWRKSSHRRRLRCVIIDTVPVVRSIS